LDSHEVGGRVGQAQAADLPSADSDDRKSGDAGLLTVRVSDFQTILTWAMRLIEVAYSRVCPDSEKDFSQFRQGPLLSHV
jgi:hypothetical protein